MTSHTKLLAVTATCVAVAAAVACSEKTGEKKPEVDKPPAEGSAATPTEPATAANTRPAVELLATAVERRLHPDRVESSSFLWNDWNRFQENYHPLYLIDDDPKTAWVEGASGNGEGEWVRIHLTEVAEATKIRLRVRNGYHKSKSLHKKNARAKGITVTSLPANHRVEASLADDMEWQTVEITQPAGPLEAIELEVTSVFPGSKYADLCISDVEIFVTSRTPENPDFEKRKFEKVSEWKAERLEAAKLFASKAAAEMPIGAAYRVVDKKEVGKIDLGKDAFTAGSRMAELATSHIKNDGVTRAAAAYKSKFSDWVPVSVAVKNARRTPAIDGLYTRGPWEVLEGIANADSYELPAPRKIEFLTSSRLSAFESSEKTVVAKALKGAYRACKREDKTHHFYFRPPGGSGDGVIRELLVIECGQVEERDGYFTYAGAQLLEYDESGLLVAAVTPAAVTTFSWSSGTSPRITGGARVRSTWGKPFVVDRLEARAN